MLKELPYKEKCYCILQAGETREPPKTLISNKPGTIRMLPERFTYMPYAPRMRFECFPNTYGQHIQKVDDTNLCQTCRPLSPRRVRESGIRKIGMFRHVFAMFWSPSVSFLNTSGNILGTSSQIEINKTLASKLITYFFEIWTPKV